MKLYFFVFCSLSFEIFKLKYYTIKKLYFILIFFFHISLLDHIKIIMYG